MEVKFTKSGVLRISTCARVWMFSRGDSKTPGADMTLDGLSVQDLGDIARACLDGIAQLTQPKEAD